MPKSLNQWVRQLHRWIAIPTFISIPIMVLTRFSGEAIVQVPPQFEMLQSFLILLLAITGAYLYLLPIITKRKRQNRSRARSSTRGNP